MNRIILTKTILLVFIISGLLLTACTSTQPKIAIESNQIDFGEVVIGEVVSHQLLVTNEGNAPLEIHAVTTSCGCTQASLEKTTILPGGTTNLFVEFDSGAHDSDLLGPMDRQVFIASNDPLEPEVVVGLTAIVISESTQ